MQNDHRADREVDEWERLQEPPEITQAWIAYLDILGYRQMIEEAVGSGQLSEHVQRLRHVLYFAEERASRLAVECELIERTRIFSDAIFIVGGKLRVESDSVGVCGMIYFLCELIGSLAEDGFFVRGAAILGKHYDEADLIVSPALIEAYDMERQEAFYPRVLIDSNVRKAYTAAVSTLRGDSSEDVSFDREWDKLWRDHDGRFFVNYLARFHDIQEHWDPPAAKEFLLKHRGQIEEHLTRFAAKPRIAAKYEWLANYHNSFCRQLGAEQLGTLDQFLIPGCGEQGPLPLPEEGV